MVKDIQINDYDYNLPDERIALHPLEERDQCKLLLRSPEGKIYHRTFKELPDLLPVDSLMVCNDTKVINARLGFQKETGAEIELFLLEPLEPADYALNFQSREKCRWKCLVGNSKKWKKGEIFCDVLINNKQLRLNAWRLNVREEGSSEIEFNWSDSSYTFGQLLEQVGRIPIPPYLNRESEAKDNEDYQTVYARVKGSVAAPTAGLHFTPAVLEGLDAHNVTVAKVTLHVGAGTFRPVKSEKIGNHAMHSEPFSVSRELIKRLIEWKSTGKQIVAVGTTTVRTLESLPYIGNAIINGAENPFIVTQWDPYNFKNIDTLETLKAIIGKMDEEKLDALTASTSIMIAPGFKWQITDSMVTNFHQPKSTLLLLVSSFLGGEEWKRVYEEALREGYRFLSYGDACLFVSSH